MTDQLRDDPFDRELRGFLAWHSEDVGGAPSAADVASRLAPQVGTRSMGLRVAPRPAWILVAGLLLAALLGALIVGSMQRHDAPLGKAYEAVFLRLEVFGGTPVVVAVGVDPTGREREIARVTDTWIAYSVETGAPQRQYLAPTGAVSPGGILAIPRAAADHWTVHWELVDLKRPDAPRITVAGIEQDIEQIQLSPYFHFDMRPSVFWGPDERVAIPWYERLAESSRWHVSLVDGHTGAATEVTIPDEVKVIPQWAEDGSGVFVMTSGERRRFMGLDGSVAPATDQVTWESCGTRDASGALTVIATGGQIERLDDAGGASPLPVPTGATYACFAPDSSAMVAGFEIGSVSTASEPVARMWPSGSESSFEVKGSFAGWIEVEGS
jgi:hypothetical protein